MTTNPALNGRTPVKRTLVLASTVVAVSVALSGCNDTSPPPRVGETSYAPGNEDPCVWDGSRWVEEDDHEPCEAEVDSGHAVKKSTRRATSTTRTTTTRRPALTARSTTKSAKRNR